MMKLTIKVNASEEGVTLTKEQYFKYPVCPSFAVDIADELIKRYIGCNDSCVDYQIQICGNWEEQE